MKGNVAHEQSLSKAMRYFSTAISQDASLAQQLNERVAGSLQNIEKTTNVTLEGNSSDKYRIDNIKSQYLIAMNLLQVVLCLADPKYDFLLIITANNVAREIHNSTLTLETRYTIIW